jgi:hypothetical protein
VQGKPDCPVDLLVTEARTFHSTLTYGASGAAGTRLSLRPLNFRGVKTTASLGQNLPRE